MKKRFKFVALIMVACMAFLLAGCDLFPQNTAYYLNQTVITATYDDGTEIKIDRREFLTAYNNYGSGLIESNGYSEKEAIDATVEALVNRKILLAEAKADSDIVANVVKEQKELYYQTYSALEEVCIPNNYSELIPYRKTINEELKKNEIYSLESFLLDLMNRQKEN